MNYSKLNDLIEKYSNYINGEENLKYGFEERQERKKYFQSFNYELIRNLSDEELRIYLKKLWNVLPITINKIIDKNGFQNFKNKLADLLYGQRNFSERYNEFHNTIVEFKASAMSEVLTYIYPNECIIWNNKVRRVFTMLGINDIPTWSDDIDFNWYTKLISYGKNIQHYINEKLNKNYDLLDIDFFYEVIFTNYSFDYKALDKIITSYKNNIESYLPNEIYKWEAVKHFQENWNIESPHFMEMLSNAFSKSDNLLVGFNYYPYQMIKRFAEKEPELTRNMFRELYNEEKTLEERYTYFQNSADKILSNGWDADKHHYQDLHAVSVYLQFMYPNKYYIYKSTIAKKTAGYLGIEFLCKDKNLTKAKRDTITYQNYIKLCDDIAEYINKDNILQASAEKYFNNNCYLEDNNHILTQDIVHYAGRIFTQKKYWILSSNPEGIECWDEFKTNNIIRIGWEKLGDLSELNSKQDISDVLNKHYPAEGSRKNDIHAIYQFANEINIDDIVIIKNGKYRLYGYGIVKSEYTFVNGKNEIEVEWKRTGDFDAQTVAPEGGFAVKTLTDITEYDNGEWAKSIIALMDKEGENVIEDKFDKENINYYWLNANPKIWSFSNIKVGECIDYTAINDNGNKRRIYQNFVDAKKGDIVLAYESTPTKAIVGLCVVEQELTDNVVLFKKIEQFAHPIKYQDIINLEELKNMEYFVNSQGSLFKVAKEEYETLIEIIRESNPLLDRNYDKYDIDDFLNEVYISKDKYIEIKNLINRKKNIILQGAPGVGKTFMAKRLAYSLMGEKNTDRIKLIQFHQSYSYEDFIEGIKPNDKGEFSLEQGIFYNFCKEAESNPNKAYYLIIDEINRGNLSKIFGELLMLIESDKRGEKLTLAYSKIPFSVPENLYIIGMMNTADRSLAIMDYALRRRFSFVDIKPAFDSEKFIEYRESLNSSYFDKIITKIKDLNKDISKDPSLGEGFMIGHSYFCNLQNVDDKNIKSIINYDIIPMLKEYWFDDENKLNEWITKLLEE